MKNLPILLIICFILLFSKLSVNSQSLNDIPFITNFKKQDYQASSQNWDIIQDDKDVMYYANNQGVMKFDGYSWDIVELPNTSIVRSLCFLGGDSIMAGAYNDFGLMHYDSIGGLIFDSWVYKIPETYHNFGEVWRIHKFDNKVVIQSFNSIFIFENEKLINTFRSDSKFKYSFVINDNFYIQEMGKGLLKLANDNLILLKATDFFSNKEIWTILPYNESEFLIGTQLQGAYIYNGERVITWNTPANKFLLQNNLFSATLLHNGNFAFGSIQEGLIIADHKGKILYELNKLVGLQNNTILSLFEDNINNLWLGLDNGIDYVKISSPLSNVRKIGGFGTGYSCVIHDNIIYAGTNQGLYYKKTNTDSGIEDSDFKLIEKTRGQVWKLRVIDETLYCTHNFGLFKIKGEKAIILTDEIGVWDISTLPENDKYLIFGSYEGFYLLNKKTDEIEAVKGFKESARRFFFDDNNDLWLSHVYRGVFRLNIDMTKRNLNVLHFFNKEKGLPSDNNNEVFYVNRNVLCATKTGVYKFNYFDNSFVKDTVWDNIFEENSDGINKLIQDGDSKYWIFKNGIIYSVTYLNDKMYEVNGKPFILINNTTVRSFENVEKIKDNNYLIGTEDGFVLYDELKRTSVVEKINLSIKYIEYLDKNNNQTIGLKIDKSKKDLGALPFKQHNLIVTLSMPFYENQSLVKQRYRINNNKWSDWKKNNVISLSEIDVGDFRIDIQCSINDIDVLGEEVVSFSILPPLHRTWKAYLIYFIFLTVIIYLLIRYMMKKVERERRYQLLKQKREDLHHSIKLKRKAQLAEGELIKLRNDKLRTDIRHKSKELANTTMSIIQKNQVLSEMKDLLLSLTKDDNQFSGNSKITRLIKRINKEIDHQDNWIVFEKNFDKVHENFLIRLKEKHAELTPKDLRLAAYLRMNLSSKEIAPLLNISIRSVEISRYRLRKKLVLGKDQNLIEYIINI